MAGSYERKTTTGEGRKTRLREKRRGNGWVDGEERDEEAGGRDSSNWEGWKMERKRRRTRNPRGRNKRERQIARAAVYFCREMGKLPVSQKQQFRRVSFFRALASIPMSDPPRSFPPPGPLYTFLLRLSLSFSLSLFPSLCSFPCFPRISRLRWSSRRNIAILPHSRLCESVHNPPGRKKDVHD